ncbi:class I mannose-6-phosphate isomerase [Novosphingobium sp.]|uniref:class I mannose-6-phosphate isomerase n=1 Tax=Novosphingobium sp. TaxID=1874826 RepID=UPI0035AEA43E
MSALLPIRMVDRPWGRTSLPAPFVIPAGQRIGEVWFEPQPLLDQLLVKYIFTSEALSVQVHPADDQAPAGQRGKEECWLVLDAEPGARLGIGFDRAHSAEALRAAARDGSIEKLLTWHPVQTGDFFSIPAGTVHAIGAGVALIEVQQNSDITYRLYDYGRPRELHLEAGMAVARCQPYPPTLHRQVPGSGHVVLVDGPLFRLDRLDGPPDAATRARFDGPVLAIPLDGAVRIAGETILPGQCGQAASLDAVEIGGRCLIAQGC